MQNRTYLCVLGLCFLSVLAVNAEIQPISEVVVAIGESQPEKIWLRSVRVNDYTVDVDQLVTGTSSGTSTAVGPPYNEITNADNLDLNLFAARNNEEPPQWQIAHLGGQEFYYDTNGDHPDFFLFETNGNDAFEVQAIFADGSFGQAVSIPKSMWGKTGLKITAPAHTNQQIMGLSWALTDLLDAQGQPLSPQDYIAGIQITSSGLDPACFCAVMGGVANQAPVVDAGPDVTLLLPETQAVLAGSVHDDGLGDPNGYLLYQWSWLEGPGAVVFEPNAYVLSPTVTCQGGAGIYVLALIATDGATETIDQVSLYLNDVNDVATVLINEILASSDPLAEEEGDWLELYNPSLETVDLSGYYLTDDLEETTKWRIPEGTTISAQGFLRIWAGDEGGDGLRTNFKLDRQGETLGLVGPDGVTILDTATYENLSSGIAWGRLPDGLTFWQTLSPSPGKTNVGHALSLVSDTRFDVDRGFFTEPFTVTVTCATPGATLAYTTDSSVPSPSHGKQGTSPLQIDITTTTVLRVMAFKEGMRATDVDTQTYLFLAEVIQQPAEVAGYPNLWTWLGGSGYDYHDYEMDPAIVNDPAYRDEIIPSLLAIPTMSIAVEPKDLASEKGFYWGSGEAACSMELIFSADPNDNLQVNAGVESHSHDRLKRSLRVNFRAEYGDSKLETSLLQDYSLYGDSATDRFDRLILRGGNNRSWARVWNPDKTTYAMDQFYRDSQLELSGYGSRGAFVHLYINGLYWGLYNPVERTDHKFTSTYFGGRDEDWFAVHHGSKNSGFHGNSSRYQTLMNDLVKRDLSNAENYALACEYVDVENFCDYMLFTWWMGVGDWPGNNWYGGSRTEQSPLGPTPLQFFAWDGEWSWDASRAGGPGYVHPDFRNTKNGGSQIPSIWHALRQNEDFMMLFADRVYQHCFQGGPLSETVAQERWLAINELIRSAVVAESARWGDAMKNQGDPTRTRDGDWQREVDHIYNMIEGNTTQFVQHLRQQGYYPDLNPPLFSQHGGGLDPADTILLTNPNAKGEVYYTIDGSDPRIGSVPVQVSFQTLIDEEAEKRVLVPNGAIHSDWRGLREYDDTSWIRGQGGVGYETSSGYESFIQIDTETAMYQQRGSCFIRIPFSFHGQADLIDAFDLSLRYDDGFVAYLNGVEVARANMTNSLYWNSIATSSHSDSQAKNWVRFNLNAYTEHLRLGDNILAIHGLNSSLGSSDFLISAKLEARTSKTVSDDIGLAGGSQVLDGPLTLPYSCTIKTRVKSGATWSALNQATFSVGPVVENLRITELMYHPPKNGSIDDPNREYIELMNIGDQDINLNQVAFTNGVTYVFPPHNLSSGAKVLIVKDQPAFTAQYGTDLPVIGTYQGSLSNGGERITLEDAIGRPIQSFKYKDSWYKDTDGKGYALEVVDPVSTDDLNNKSAWQASEDLSGTPGR